jgi:hypothetical protein
MALHSETTRESLCAKKEFKKGRSGYGRTVWIFGLNMRTSFMARITMAILVSPFGKAQVATSTTTAATCRLKSHMLQVYVMPKEVMQLLRTLKIRLAGKIYRPIFRKCL